jgi:hypothetical protein
MTRSRRREQHQRERRPERHGIRIGQVAFGPALGEGVVSASLEDLERALAGQPEELRWNDVADQVIPVMPRLRPYPPGFPELLRVMVDPGVAIGFAIDIGPALMNVGTDLLRSWGIPIGELHARSFANLAARAGRIEGQAIVEGSLDGSRTRWLQTGHSVGSVMVLLPDALGQVFGRDPAFFITPMRDLIIGLRPDADRDLAAWLWLEIASEDPNCLGPIGYRFDGRAVVPEPLDPQPVGMTHVPSRQARLA